MISIEVTRIIAGYITNSDHLIFNYFDIGIELKYIMMNILLQGLVTARCLDVRNLQKHVLTSLTFQPQIYIAYYESSIFYFHFFLLIGPHQ